MRTTNMFDNSIDQMLSSAVAKATDMTTRSIRGKYGYSFNITSSGMGSLAIEKVNNWIKKYDPKYKERVNEMNPLLHDTTFVLPLEVNTYLFVTAGRSDYSTADVIRYMMSDNKNGNSSSTDLFLYVFGKKAKKYKNEIDAELSKIASSLYVYNVSGGSPDHGGRDEFNSIVSDMHQRQIDTLFFDKGVKEAIINHIDQFLANSSIYKERDLLYKTGILLYGKPGTGKSSLANALATKYKSSLIIVDMGTFAYLDTVALSQSINADNERYVILLEDIDCIFNSLNREKKDGKTADEDERKVINKFLQFLDSNSSPNNVIFIATTNHKEELDATFDEAILRAGRFDLKQEINGIHIDAAREMCRSFNMDNEKIEEVLEKESFPINQSHLQNLILQSMTGKVIAPEVEGEEKEETEAIIKEEEEIDE